MPRATMTSKGQITIPKIVREDLSLVPGSAVMFVRLPGGRYELVPRSSSIDELAGILHDPDRRTLTLAAMEEAVIDGATEHAMRGVSDR